MTGNDVGNVMLSDAVDGRSRRQLAHERPRAEDLSVACAGADGRVFATAGPETIDVLTIFDGLVPASRSTNSGPNADVTAWHSALGAGAS